MTRTILAGAVAAPALGGLAWRTARQRQVAKALEITTLNGIAEQRFVTVGGQRLHPAESDGVEPVAQRPRRLPRPWPDSRPWRR
jgi:hypothetical protein